MTRVLFGPGETKVSRKGRAPSWFGSSMVTYICGSCDLMCYSNCWLYFPSSLYLSHRWGVWAELRALTSNSSMNRLEIRGLMGDPRQHTVHLFITLTLEEEVCVFVAKLKGVWLFVLWTCWSFVRSGSCCNFYLTMLMEGSTGTEIKRALTS